MLGSAQQADFPLMTSLASDTLSFQSSKHQQARSHLGFDELYSRPGRLERFTGFAQALDLKHLTRTVVHRGGSVENVL